MIVGIARLWLQVVEQRITILEDVEAVKRDIEEGLQKELERMEQFEPEQLIDEE